MHAKPDIDSCLIEAKRCFAERRPESAAMLARGARSMPGGNTRSVLFYDPFPIVMARGQDTRLWDVDGLEYVDFLGEFTAGLYGHSNPVIRAAIDRALDGGTNLSAHTPYEVELAELVVARFPSIDLVRFTNSGTEANLMAVTLARAATGRSRILVFTGAYHGGVLSFLAGASPVNIAGEFVYAVYNDLAGAKALIETHAADLAAVLLEPMLGAGGCLPGDPEFLKGVEAAAKRAGAVVILDEIQTSRLAPGGRQQLIGLDPDITTLGKYIGGGGAIGAFGGKAALMDMFSPGRPNALQHAGTFNNNVISMAAGAAGLREIYTTERVEALNRAGDDLRGRLNDLFSEANAPLQLIGLGSLMNVHATNRSIRSFVEIDRIDNRLRDLLFFFLADRGYYIARRGLIALNLELRQTQIAGLYDEITKFLDRYRRLWT
ncbi:glutamate-1-semialdehyde 2,1-aminomutase [Sphingomonas sp. Root50]|nr:glutamate-1-semialdehyde 2,1-aminomutase [Sphingomonas sp. Root1294]KQY68416.1 glutamate-1-semialdehyde 2,1-aminomutase [Sphingomonas sp. Root50]KRB91378.1 glutamate-1-semialdehyde 2,1-aminomutase [Sphingomonas sp. Root720]